tara:strand:+ start:429 stop:839 length:411 start_codon:yes stop_codon:yes gene_type:complete
MKTFSLSALLVLLIMGGCKSPPGPFAPQDTTKYTLENTEMFVLMDQKVQHSVTSTGIQRGTTTDGRLQVVANIKNRENRRIQVQVSCVFKDGQGFATGDETPWETLILGENETKAVSFAAMNANAERFTVRVRQSR